jgi:recombination protein RecA
MAKSKQPSVVVQDVLAETLATNLNKQFKSSNLKVAYFLEGDDDVPTDVKEWVSTGSTALDLAISNRPNGGYPVGRIVELTGLEAAGKSLLAAHALANTQKKGGMAVYIDTEMATSREFLGAIGVDLKEMLYVPLETIEDIFEATENIINTVRQTSKDRLVTIVVDSIAGASTKVEMAADFDKDGYNTTKAILLSKAMRKITNLIGRERILLIFTNQLRSNMNASMFADKYTTSGGKGIPYHASVRVRLAPAGMIKAKRGTREEVIGIKTSAKVVKNRLGPPLRSVTYDIYFDRGVDDTTSILELLKQLEIIEISGAWHQYVDETTGEVIKFQSKDYESKVLSNPVLKEQIYNKLCDKFILKYRSAHDIEIVEEHIAVDDEE